MNKGVIDSASYDVIVLEQIKLVSLIGVNEWERRTPKQLKLDLTLAVDTAAAAQTDALSETLDYSAVVALVVSFTGESEFQLLEALAEGIADQVLETYSVPWVRLKLTKPGVMSGVEAVSLIIERIHPEAESFSRARLPL